jgi:two-component system, OmpR family, phosphate regulon response regulator PhoB
MKKIVVAEDNKDMLFILDTILKDEGYDVEALPNGISIVQPKSNQRPDLYILDKDMPLIDGIAVAKYLKLNPETKDIPIIMISAYHRLRVKAKDAGVDAFIEKPFELSYLKATIDKYVNRQYAHT